MNGRLERRPLDVLEMLVGLGLFLWGVAQWSPPAAACVAGAVLFAFGYAGRRVG